MSQVMDLIDEARAERDQARQQAAQWHYVAILFALATESTEWRWPKKDRNIERYYLVPEEMKAGALRVTLMETPEQEQPDMSPDAR